MADKNDVAPNFFFGVNDFYVRKMLPYQNKYGLSKYDHNAAKHAAVSAIYADAYGVRKAKFWANLLELYNISPGQDNEKDYVNNHIGRTIQQTYPGRTASEYYDVISRLAKMGWLQTYPKVPLGDLTLDQYQNVMASNAIKAIREHDLFRYSPVVPVKPKSPPAAEIYSKTTTKPAQPALPAVKPDSGPKELLKSNKDQPPRRFRIHDSSSSERFLLDPVRSGIPTRSSPDMTDAIDHETDQSDLKAVSEQTASQQDYLYYESDFLRSRANRPRQVFHPGWKKRARRVSPVIARFS